MPKLSQTSKNKLFTCHQDLIDIVQEAIKIYDFTVLYGHRTPLEQINLYSQGRELIDGNWVIVDKKKIVTYCDGSEKPSKHNSFPSLAVDLAPYPIDWKDLTRFRELSDLIKKIALEKNIKIKWGGDFKGTFKDSPHFELIV